MVLAPASKRNLILLALQIIKGNIMRAAVFYGAKDFRVEELEKPKIGPTDVLIRVRACGICGSDLHAYKEGIFSRPGFVMGHEMAGEVVEVGSRVEGIAMGDRVVPLGGVRDRGCGECFWCRRGQTQWCSAVSHKPCRECSPCRAGRFWLCEKNQRYMLAGYSRNGGYAEYMFVPDAGLNRNVYSIPDSVSFEEASFLEPLWGAYKWVEMAEPQPRDTAVVTGLGTIGLLVVQVLKERVSRVIVSDVSQKRLQLARELGADVVIDAAEEDPLAKVIELTGSGRSFSGRGGGRADVVIECSGAPEAFKQAIEMTRTGGHIVLVGLYEHDISFDVNRIIHKQLKLVSSFNRGRRSPSEEIIDCMTLIESGKVKVKPLISHEFSLDEIMPAFEVQTKPSESVKVMMKP
jgi:2-desacetyl-2-hydroxyethyl bacteriochlorophyllide A dehydrogenase